ncbi:capreomycidine synthase [Streptomyces anulatus]
MNFDAALLEDWMRDHYHDAAIDIGSSGVLDYSFGQVRQLAGIEPGDMDQIVLRDSPCLGRDDLREAIASRWGDGDARRVMLTHGGSEAIYVALQTLLEPGDQVVALHPAYHSHVSVAESMGCEVLRWRLREEDAFRPDVEELARIVTARTKVIVVNFPHNPTGATLDLAGFRRLLEIADDVGAYLLWDGAFTDLVYDDAPLPDPGLTYPRTVSIGTFSKSFGLPGMRFGWCMADPELLRAMTNLRDRITLSLSPLIEFIALRVVRHAEAFIAPKLKNATGNRRLLVDWAARHEDRVDLPLPLGGVTAFPQLRPWRDTTELCRRLGETSNILLVPGRAFDHPCRVRLGFGGDRSQLSKGLDILGAELVASRQP